MTGKKRLGWLSVGLGVCAGLLLTLGLLLKHEPNFYRNAAVGQGQERVKWNNEFVGNLVKFDRFWKESTGKWEVAFSEAQINSYFQEGFLRFGDAETLRKHGISEPCIRLEQDRLRLAFRYGSGFWSTVVSYDLNLWLAPKDLNMVMMEIRGHHAGGLPISSQSLLNEISEVARRSNIDVSWYRVNGNPVAAIRFQPEQTRPTAKLIGLETKSGVLLLQGTSTDSRTTAEPKSPAPAGN